MSTKKSATKRKTLISLYIDFCHLPTRGRLSIKKIDNREKKATNRYIDLLYHLAAGWRAYRLKKSIIEETSVSRYIDFYLAARGRIYQLKIDSKILDFFAYSLEARLSIKKSIVEEKSINCYRFFRHSDARVRAHQLQNTTKEK